MGRTIVFSENQLTRNTKDKNIRVALSNMLSRELSNQYSSNKIIKIYHEFSIDHGDNRIDIVTVNGDIHGYEIKSDADSLNRLPAQVEAYNRVFGRVTLVAGVSHIYDALFMIPDWWGVILAKGCIDGSVVFSNLRDPLANPSQDMMSVIRLLWRQEVLEALSDMDEAHGVRSKSREYVYKRFVEVADRETIQNTVINKLFNRETWRVGQSLPQYGG